MVTRLTLLLCAALWAVHAQQAKAPCGKREISSGEVEECTAINVEFTKLSDREVEHVIRALRLPSFVYLRLRDNKLTVKQSEAIMLAVVDSPAVRGLSFRENELGMAATTALTRALAESDNLKNVDLRSAKLGDEGAAVLAEGLTKLTTLNIEGNNIGPEGMSSIAAALEAQPSTLESLYVGNNPMSDRGAAALARAIQLAPGHMLSAVFVSDKSIGEEGKAALRVAAQETDVSMYDMARQAIRKQWKDEL